jgi:hypothetical protein
MRPDARHISRDPLTEGCLTSCHGGRFPRTRLCGCRHEANAPSAFSIRGKPRAAALPPAQLLRRKTPRREGCGAESFGRGFLCGTPVLGPNSPQCPKFHSSKKTPPAMEGVLSFPRSQRGHNSRGMASPGAQRQAARVTKAQLPTAPRALSRQYSVCVSILVPAAKPFARQSALTAAPQSGAPLGATAQRSRPETIAALGRGAGSLELSAQAKRRAPGISAAANRSQHGASIRAPPLHKIGCHRAAM